MTSQTRVLPDIEIPSRKRIAKAALIAAIVAALILVTAILPAEYGIDPLKTGRALGLTSLSQAAASPAENTPATNVVVTASTVTGTYIAQPAVYKVDSRDLKLGPFEGVEIKYQMEKSSGMVYSWKATSKVLYEFHGEPAGAPKDYFDSYEKDDKIGKDRSNGSFTAPSTGIHGWFWENPEDETITVHLVTAGFYSVAKEFRDDKQTLHQLRDAK